MAITVFADHDLFRTGDADGRRFDLHIAGSLGDLDIPYFLRHIGLRDIACGEWDPLGMWLAAYFGRCFELIQKNIAAEDALWLALDHGLCVAEPAAFGPAQYHPLQRI